jgi:uncharacterized protein YbjT (DUF2867 family)
MRVILFGSTGMIGQGALRECLLAPDVEEVLAVVRAPSGRTDQKLRELVHADFTDFTAAAGEFAGYDACLYCLGVSSTGMSEADYTRITYEMPMATARVLAEVNPDVTFVYVSGRGTDATEAGRTMWARVKGRAENALIALLPNAYAVRPGIIQPVHGATSRTRLYRIAYAVLRPVVPLLRRLFPRAILTTEEIGLAMLRVARDGYPTRVLETGDLRNAAAAGR